MTTKELKNKARYFGGMIGNNIKYKGELVMVGAVIYGKDIDILLEKYKGEKRLILISLPEDKELLKHIKIPTCKKKAYDTEIEIKLKLRKNCFTEEAFQVFLKTVNIYKCKECGSYHYSIKKLKS
jgi:hypothetical protein